MSLAELILTDELEKAFKDAQSGKVRFLKVLIEGESFVLSETGVATADASNDCMNMVNSYLQIDQPAFILFCPNVNIGALWWTFIAFVPDTSAVRDKMLYSSSRDSLKQQLGSSYFTGEFHATEKVDITLENLIAVRKKQLENAPLNEKERILKEAAKLECDTNVKSTAMGVIPFEISQNVRDKLTLLRNGTFEWIAMKLNADESVDVSKSLETVDFRNLTSVIDTKSPSFVAYRCRPSQFSEGTITTTTDTHLIFLYICPEDAPIKQKMSYSTCKATVLSAATALGLVFDKTIEINNPVTAVEDIQSELAPVKREDDQKTKEFTRPTAPGRGRGRGRRGPPLR